MKFLVISGLSGGGKSSCAGLLEDMDYYVVDNMPAVLMPRFAELCLATRGRYDSVALVTDARGREGFDALFKALDEMKSMGCDYEILFIEASPETIVKRYKETRHRHPLDSAGSDIEGAVFREKRLLAPVRERADHIIDTTGLTLARLRGELVSMFSSPEKIKSLTAIVTSFGYKYGIPTDADLVFDVRFLPNPFYVEALAPRTGEDAEVAAYVMDSPISREFMQRLEDMLRFLIPNYVEEGKHSLVIAVGCTGGRHRSVAVASAVAGICSNAGCETVLTHRDAAK